MKEQPSRASFSPGYRQQLHTETLRQTEATCPQATKSTPARMAESVDALVSNTSGAIRAGSIPAPGTEAESQSNLRLHFL